MPADARPRSADSNERRFAPVRRTGLLEVLGSFCAIENEPRAGLSLAFR